MRLSSILLVGLLLASSCASTSGGGSARTSRAPDFILDSVAGRPTRYSTVSSKKVVLMNFWATWCGPCTQELPHLQQIYNKYKDQGFEVVSIAMDGPESVAAVAPFVRQTGLTFPVLLDTESKAVSLYNPTRSAPFNVFLDRNGKIVTTKEGYAPGDEVEIEKIIVSLLQAPQAAPAAP